MRLRYAFLAPLIVLPLFALGGTRAPAAGTDACTGRPSATRLYVNVSNIRSAKGLIAVTLYADDSKKFLAKRGSLYVGRVPAAPPAMPVCIHIPAPGIYALAVYHDENANTKFDRKGIGLPAEGYGFSNNAATVFGLPAFKAVRLNVPRTDMETAVKLKYP